MFEKPEKRRTNSKEYQENFVVTWGMFSEMHQGMSLENGSSSPSRNASKITLGNPSEKA